MTNLAMSETAFDNLQNVMQNAGELKTRVEYSKITDNTFATKLYNELFPAT